MCLQDMPDQVTSLTAPVGEDLGEGEGQCSPFTPADTPSPHLYLLHVLGNPSQFLPGRYA